jgi:hypothetical protein
MDILAPTLEQVRRAFLLRATNAGVAVVTPDDPRRVVIVAAVWAASSLGGSSWSHDDVAQRVSMTLPGIGTPGIDLLRGIPVAGPLLAGAVAPFGGAAVVCLSPLAWNNARQLATTGEHELGHAGWIKLGGIPKCLGYLGFPEVRAAGEGPCYAASMAVAVRFFGVPVEDAARAASASMGGYALDAPAQRLFDGIITSAARSLDAGDDLGGVTRDFAASLYAVGYRAPA